MKWTKPPAHAEPTLRALKRRHGICRRQVLCIFVLGRLGFVTNLANHGLLDATLALWIFDAPNLLTLVPSLADEAELPLPRSPDDTPLNMFRAPPWSTLWAGRRRRRSKSITVTLRVKHFTFTYHTKSLKVIKIHFGAGTHLLLMLSMIS